MRIVGDRHNHDEDEDDGEADDGGEAWDGKGPWLVGGKCSRCRR